MAGIEDSPAARAYRNATRELESLGYATSSVPVSYDSVCFAAIGENACISTGGHVPPKAENFICTLQQGLDLERVWNAVGPDANGSTERADAKLLAHLEEFRANLRASPPASCRNAPPRDAPTMQ